MTWLTKHPRLTISLGLLCLLLAAILTLFEISRARCFALAGEAICHVETDQRVVALTFDDGPTPEGVAIAEAALRPADAHATFFAIGGEIPGHEPLIRQLLADGNEVGNHSFSHVRMALHTAAFYDEEIERTDALLRGAGVPSPSLFRPPYGKKLLGLPLALERHNERMIMWDVEDPPEAMTAGDYAAGILREVRPGSIILMHIMYRGDEIARAALPLVVAGLRERGYRMVTVGELLRLRR